VAKLATKSRRLTVVDGHAAILVIHTVAHRGDGLERAILVLVIELGSPVVGEVILNGARRAFGCTGLIISHVKAETASTAEISAPSRHTGVCNIPSDFVSMAGNLSREHDWIRTFFDLSVG
jgi:hypothetical protein